ncbi:MAG: hypothetical protein Q9199_004267, partial [Rusavskia elegans]
IKQKHNASNNPIRDLALDRITRQLQSQSPVDNRQQDQQASIPYMRHAPRRGLFSLHVDAVMHVPEHGLQEQERDDDGAEDWGGVVPDFVFGWEEADEEDAEGEEEDEDEAHEGGVDDDDAVEGGGGRRFGFSFFLLGGGEVDWAMGCIDMRQAFLLTDDRESDWLCMSSEEEDDGEARSHVQACAGASEFTVSIDGRA